VGITAGSREVWEEKARDKKRYYNKQMAYTDYVHNLMRQWNTSYQHAPHWREKST